jgi:hypothetical protein
MIRKYDEKQIAAAILMMLEENLTPPQAAKRTGINVRALQRYKLKYVGKPELYPFVKPEILEPLEEAKAKTRQAEVITPVVIDKTPVATEEVVEAVDQTILKRAKFLDKVFDAKEVLLNRLVKIGVKSQNVDALQRSIKMLHDIEKEVVPEDDKGNPLIYAKQVNMFQTINQNLIDNGYKGPELKESDIVKGDR